MSLTTPVQPTEVEGLVNDSATTGSSQNVAYNVGVAAGRELIYAGQTANTSAANVANQAIGTFQIPSGTANGTAITVPNTLVGANSIIMLQLCQNPGQITELAVDPAAIVAGTSFAVKVYTSANTGANADCWYQILN